MVEMWAKIKPVYCKLAKKAGFALVSFNFEWEIHILQAKTKLDLLKKVT